MEYTKGQLVSHPKLGLGKVLSVSGSTITIFFKDQDRNPTKISLLHSTLDVVHKSDPWLDSLDFSEEYPKYLTQKAALEKFLRLFPQGFEDPGYFKNERDYKWAAHEQWNLTLGRVEFETLLQSASHGEIIQRALKIESKLNLLATFEKAALRDGLKEPESMKLFSEGLHALIYGNEAFEARFKRFSEILGTLPQKKTSTSKWPIQTLFPFIALPGEHLFLKPTVTQEATKRRAYNLNYEPQPNWETYSRLLRFVDLLREDLKELHPRDMIDIQSFIWVTGDDSYKKS